MNRPQIAAAQTHQCAKAAGADQGHADAEHQSADNRAGQHITQYPPEGRLQRLPPAQAQAIRKTRIDGLSIIEAAAALGQSEALIKVNVHRGLKRLSLLIETETP
jgi:DNA-directed RNA polymerase specialized sigma24 family protein